MCIRDRKTAGAQEDRQRQPKMEASDAGTSYLELDKDDEVVEFESLSTKDIGDKGVDLLKDWFKEHVTKRVQARAAPDEEDEESAWTAGPAAQKRFAAAAEVAAKAQADRLGERVGGWEIHEKGVASKLMAKMGYVRGSGLGKHAQGRTDILPIPAPRRGTRDCENPGLGAPEAAPVEAPPGSAGGLPSRTGRGGPPAARATGQ